MVPNHLVSLKTGLSSIMLIASEPALGFRRQKQPHLGLREALHSGALYCAGIWEWDERVLGREKLLVTLLPHTRWALFSAKSLLALEGCRWYLPYS